LESAASVNGIEWKEVIPNTRHDWLTEGMSEAFESFLPLGTKAAKSSRAEAKAIFKIFSLGVGTNRDPWVYSFDLLALKERVATFVEVYQATLDRVKRRHPKSAEDVIDTTDHRIQWTRQIKAALLRHEETAVNPDHFRIAVYRPFTKLHLYFDEFWNEERYQQHLLFPTTSAESENRALCVGGYGRKQFAVLMCNLIPNLNFYADPAQCFSFYTYAADGTNRRENITDWALEQFRTQYNDNRISKWDLFHYVYAILQHPLYRERYAANLRRELPRIPFVPAFWEFVEAGAGLAELHVNYEKQAEYPLQVLESKDVPLNWQVEKMRLSKDKAQITYNNFLTLAGIPLEVFEYRLGNRSALEWIIDQYQIKTDKRSAILNDPNRHDDPEYIVRLVGKIVTVSLKTIRIVKDLPSIE
jgi:predicted helicase